MLECWILNALFLSTPKSRLFLMQEGTQIHQSWKEQDWLPCRLVLDVVPLPSTLWIFSGKKSIQRVRSHPITPWQHFEHTKSCGFANLYQVGSDRVRDFLIYPVLEICDSDSYAESRKTISGGVTRCLRFASEEATCRGASSHNAKRHFYPPWEGKSRF